MSSTFEVDFGSLQLADGGSFDRFDLYVLNKAAFEVYWTGADAVDGAIRIEESVSGDVWFLASAETPINIPMGARLYKFDDLSTRFVRVTVVKGSNTTGTVYCQAIGKP